MELMRLSPVEAVELVEALSSRPGRERAGRVGLPHRRLVPLTKSGSAVAAILENSRDRRGGVWHSRGVAVEPGADLCDRAHVNGVVIATGQQRGAGGAALGRGVEIIVGEAPLREAREGR